MLNIEDQFVLSVSGPSDKIATKPFFVFSFKLILTIFIANSCLRQLRQKEFILLKNIQHFVLSLKIKTAKYFQLGSHLKFFISAIILARDELQKKVIHAL
jgi:hypothetical protein